MKKYLLLLSLLCIGYWGLAQNLSLEGFNHTRQQRQKTAMTILGAWAIGNIAAGAALQGGAQGERKYFHQMNIGWNAVNLAIAGLGYWGAQRIDPGGLGLYESIQGHYGLQKTLLFNAGLDVGYMLGGAYLIERAKNTAPDKNPQRLKGFGQSIVLQGAFLFAFDLGVYFWLASGNGDIPILLGPASEGIGLSWRFGK
jgi:hypothetical protein